MEDLQSGSGSSGPPTIPHKGASLRWLAVAWIVVTGIAIILRFWSRAIIPQKRRFGLDDWTALMGWPLVAAFELIIEEWSRVGLGHHIISVPLPNIRKGLKIVYGGYITYNYGMTMMRYSAILFYDRIFEPSKSANHTYRNLIYGALALNTAWVLAFGIIAFVPCVPIHAFWDKPLLQPKDYSCPSTLALQMSSGITSVLMDLMVLLLPVPRLWRLQTSWRKKSRVLVLFLIGYCVIVFTIGRLVAIVIQGDGFDRDITLSTQATHSPSKQRLADKPRFPQKGAFVTPLYWYSCEIAVASISISLPAIFSLGIRATTHGFASLFTAKNLPSSGGSYPNDAGRAKHGSHANRGGVSVPDEEGFVRLEGSEGKFDGLSDESVGGKEEDGSAIPLESISPHVKGDRGAGEGEGMYTGGEGDFLGRGRGGATPDGWGVHVRGSSTLPGEGGRRYTGGHDMPPWTGDEL